MIAILLLACSSSEVALSNAELFDTGSVASDGEPLEVELRVDVFPSELQAAGGDYRALPQSFGRFAFAGTSLDLGVLELRRPVPVAGVIFGREVSPSWLAPELPSSSVALVEAGIRIAKDDSVQDYSALTADDGVFQSYVVPQESYRLEIVPLDPRVPVVVEELQVESSAPEQGLEIDPGVALFGTVRDESAPLAGAAVAVVNSEGVISAAAFTDATGHYEVRVRPEQSYTVICSGRDFELDPLLVSAPLEIGGTGLRHDFEYPSPSAVLVDGRVEDAAGNPLGGATVRFTSTELTGYDELEHETVVEVVTSNDGQFTRRILSGTYTTEFLPAPAEQERDDHTPIRLDNLVVRGGTLTLPTQRLEKLTPFSGRLVDILGEGVPGALLACTELSFGQRSWSTQADDSGFFDMRISRQPVRCTMTPPGGRLDLPLTSFDLDPVNSDGRLPFARGVIAQGSVVLDGAPEPFAFVELTDRDGRRYGSALTDSGGNFEVQLAIQ